MQMIYFIVLRFISYYLGLIILIVSFFLLFLSILIYRDGIVFFIVWLIYDFLSLSIVYTVLIDWIRLIFIGFVLLISGLVSLYRIYYIEGDKNFVRFILLVYLFVLSILLIIIRPNLISILLGWDGLGLVSYGLVVYYQREKSNNAGMLTILSNRVGDVAILLRIAWVRTYGAWNFIWLQSLNRLESIKFIIWLVVLAGITKRAQIPFSAWLPAAIAAPTPVSALVHSSTLVTAGVYLLIRFNMALGVNEFLFYLGSFTMFMAGAGANYETDLKKVIALSTLRQLGVIIITLSLGCVELSFFHLLSHALFKSLLFLCAGVFIHVSGDLQDIRYLGGSSIGSPRSAFFFLACSLSLCGFPFLSGFYSKDMILESYFIININFFMLLFLVVGTLLTATYSIRVIVFIFFKNLGLKSISSTHEVRGMLFPMSILFFCSVYMGGGFSWFILPYYCVFLPLIFKLIILIGIVGLRYLVYSFLINYYLFLYDCLASVTLFLSSIWFMPIISTYFLMPILLIGERLIKHLDQGWLEVFGGQGAFSVSRATGVYMDYSLRFNLKIYLFSFVFLITFLVYYI